MEAIKSNDLMQATPQWMKENYGKLKGNCEACFLKV